ncbi:MAG: DUF167 domain-containing protein [Planctomycetota bacterium]
MSAYTPVALVQTKHGVELPVRAIPGASRNEIGGSREGALLVRITTAPEKGKANQAIIALLAEALDLRKKDLDLIRGERHRNKCFLLVGAELATIEEQILSWSQRQRDRSGKEKENR